MELTVGNRFRLESKIAIGNYSNCYNGHDIDNNNEEKLESKHPQLLHESKIYMILKGSFGFPKLYWYGQEGDFSVLVFDLYGPSLEDLFVRCERKFSLKTVVMLGHQMISRLECLHSKNIIHRDIKPENFLIGRQSTADTVFLVDFGISKSFRDPRTGLHIPPLKEKNIIGSARFASINTHLGFEQSRRDDLESLAYIIIYFLKGSLPWQGIEAVSQEDKFEKIKDSKIFTPVKELCEDMPVEISQFLDYTRGLRFEETPDYEFLKELLRNLFFKYHDEWNFVFDWVELRATESLPDGHMLNLS